MKRLSIFSLMAYLASGGVCQAATYYVSKSGSNNNSCAQAQSVSTPKLTIVAGVACLSGGGDTLLVRAGTYSDEIGGVATTLASGTSWSNKVRIAAYPDGCAPGKTCETVWVTPTAIGGSSPDTASPIYLYNGEHYIEFDGINADCRNVPACVAFVVSSGRPDVHHIRFKNAEVYAAYSTLALSYSAWSQWAVQLGGHFAPTEGAAQGGSEVLNCTIHGGGAPSGPGNDVHYNGYGIYIAGPNNLVDGNNIYDNSNAGIHIYNGAGDAPDNNIIRNNRIHDIVHAGNTAQVWGILVIGSNNQIYNNVISGINVGDVATGNAGIAVTRSGNMIYNNTVANNTNTGIYLDSGAVSTDVRNNIVYASTGSNLVNQGSATVQSNNLIGVDPRFVNGSANNFQLQSGSPAIDAGVSVSAVTVDLAGVARPQGRAPDIGAYEYRAGQTASAPPVVPSAPSNLKIFP
jgi:parallel beta-helix repeat protein